MNTLMEQDESEDLLPLFAFAKTHRGDPPTARLNAAGAVTPQAMYVLNLVRAFPGSTASELGRRWAEVDGSNPERRRLAVARRMKS